MSQPLVSVIVPAYQAERLVGGALTSALTQTYPHLEVVVTDDGSRDRTADVLRGYGDLVRVVTQDNKGLPGARNSAIREARGELVCLLDADDILLPAHVEQAVEVWSRAGGGRRFVTCEALLLSRAGIVPGRTVLPSGQPPVPTQRLRILENNFVSGFAVFPRAMWEEIDGFDETMRVCEDYDFWARAIYAGYQVLFQPTPSALYRRMDGTLSTQNDRMYDGDRLVMQHLQDRYGGTMSDAERAFLQLRLAEPSPHRAIHLGEDALRRGDHHEAAAHFRDAARLLPSDSRITRKAVLLSRAPVVGRLYAARLRRTDRETGRRPD